MKKLSTVALFLIFAITFSTYSQWQTCSIGLNTVKSHQVIALCVKGQNIFKKRREYLSILFILSENTVFGV